MSIEDWQVKTPEKAKRTLERRKLHGDDRAEEIDDDMTNFISAPAAGRGVWCCV